MLIHSYRIGEGSPIPYSLEIVVRNDNIKNEILNQVQDDEIVGSLST